MVLTVLLLLMLLIEDESGRSVEAGATSLCYQRKTRSKTFNGFNVGGEKPLLGNGRTLIRNAFIRTVLYVSFIFAFIHRPPTMYTTEYAKLHV